MESPLRARTDVRRSTISGAYASCALFTTWLATAVVAPLPRRTSTVEPLLITMPRGMLFISRRSCSSMPKRLATSREGRFCGATQAVQDDSEVGSALASAFWKTAALFQGSSTCGVPAAKITGLRCEGLSALKSSSRTWARRAAMSTSMSCLISTVSKKGWFSISGSTAPWCCGWAMMFLTACSLGT